MNNSRVRAIVRKELVEYRRNKMIVITMAMMPLLFVAITLLGAVAIGQRMAAAPPEVVQTLTDKIAGQATFFLLLVVLIIPTTVAAYSVIGERDQGTLEPVLTTPATDAELLLGKLIAAGSATLLVAWGMYVVYAIAVRFTGIQPLVDRVWAADLLVAELVLVPALAVLAVIVGMIVSGRSSDIRVAQQITALILLPVLVGAVLVQLGIVTPSGTLYGVVGVAVAAIDIALWLLLVRTFDRERLLTGA